MTLGQPCSFVPPYLLERIAASDSAAADHCRSTLATDQAFRAGRQAAPHDAPRPRRPGGSLGRPHRRERLHPARQRGPDGG